jgi:Asp-tRNA(Asn)/Glu-tRNA(Gln) amidotransferase B subunit
MFGIMVAVAVQSAFRLEIHQNNIFKKKNYF